MYYNGLGVAKNEAQAVHWFRKAAEQGHASAQYNLGVSYAYGLGVAKSEAQAVRWYRKAAEQGYASAQYNLGLMYAAGKGIPKDYIQATKWLYLAKASGEPDVDKVIQVIEAGMTRDQMEKAQRLASKWWQDHQ